ncbi:MAG: PAS domain S-box protein [Paludibacter sp.]
MERKKIKILAIDDNPDNIITIKALIMESFQNAVVLTALNGLKGLELAAAEEPDVILLDIVMPDMDGFDVCQKLKNDKNTSEIPVVFVTAIKGDKSSRIKALEVGADAFLAKPIDESELVAQIRAMVKIRTASLEKRNESMRLTALVEERTRELNENYISTVNLFEDLNRENTMRRETEKALIESQERYRTLIENSSEAIYVVQNEKFVFANPACNQISGISSDELLGKSLMDFVSDEQKEKIRKQHKDLLEGIVKGNTGTYSIQRKQGDYVWLTINSVRIIWNDLPASLNFASDITERKNAEDALKESEAKFRDMANLLPQIVFEMDLNGVITYVNDQSVAILGYTNTELVGQKSVMVHVPEERDRIVDLIQQKPSWTEIVDREYTMLRKDGTVFTALIYTNGILKDNNLIGFRGIIIDITDRKKVEEELLASELKYRNLMDNSPEGITIYIEGKIAYVNKEATRLMRAKDKSELLGKSLTDFIHTQNKEMVLERMKYVALSPVNVALPEVEEIYTRLDGTEMYVEIKAMPIIFDNKFAVQISGHDITDRIEAQEKIRQSELFLKETQKIARLGSYSLNLADSHWVSSEVLNEIFGIPSDYDKSIEGWASLIHPDWQTAVSDYFEQEVIGKQANFDKVYKIIRHNDKSECWVHGIGELQFDLNHRIIKMIGSIQDITDIKKAEEKLIESELFLKETQKIARLGSYTFNFTDNNWTSSEVLNEIFGIPDDFDKSFESWESFIHPEWKKIVSDYFEQEVNVRKSKFDKIYQIIRQTDKTPLWIHDIAELQFDKDNQLIGLIGSVQDIQGIKMAEEALRESESKYFELFTLLRSMSDTMPDMMWAKNLNNEYIFANEAFCKRILNAVDTSEPIGKTDIFFAQRERDSHPDDPNWHTFGEICADTDVVTLQKMKEMQFDEYGNVKGKFIFLDVNKAPLFNEKKELIGVVGSGRDVTGRKIMEQTLRDNEQYTSSLLAAIPDLMFVLDADGNFLDYKSGSGMTLYVSKDEFMGKSLFEFLPEHIAQQTKEAIDGVIQKKPVDPFEYELTVENVLRAYECKVFPFGESKVIAMIRDITTNKQILQKLENNRAELKAIYDNAPVVMCVLDEQRHILFANHAFNAYAISFKEDMKYEQALGGVIGCVNSLENPNGCGYGKDCKKCTLKLSIEDSFLTGNVHTNIEYETIIVKNGIKRDVSLLGSTSIIDTDGKRTLLLSLIDITERKQAEDALHKSEMFLRTFIENTPFEIWARDINNVGILENKKMIEHFGSILGKTSDDFSKLHPDTVELWNSNNKRVLAGEMIDELVEYVIGNKKYTYQQIIFPIYNNGLIIGISGFNIDISERKRIESELLETQLLYHSFIEQLPNPVFRKDSEGRYVLVNSQFCKLKGISKEEFIGKKPLEISIKEDANRIAHGFDVQYSSLGEDIHDQILQTGNTYEMEEEYPAADGSKPFMHVLRMPVVDSSGAIVGSQGIMFDITERKEAEKALNQSEEQLKKFASHLQNVREEEKIALAREIHDDLGQILVALKIDMGMLKQKVLKSNTFVGSEDILAKFDNLVELTDTTIKTARRIMNGLRPEQLDLLGFVEATRQYLIEFEGRHHLTCEFICDISHIDISSQQSVALFRIVQEALTNIVKHAKANRITVHLTKLGDKLLLEVQDNGIGFDMNNRGRQDSYGMIGMKERVFLLGGILNISSQIGLGTIVKVEVPSVTEPKVETRNDHYNLEIPFD